LQRLRQTTFTKKKVKQQHDNFEVGGENEMEFFPLSPMSRATFRPVVPDEVHYGENCNVFLKHLNIFLTEERHEHLG